MTACGGLLLTTMRARVNPTLRRRHFVLAPSQHPNVIADATGFLDCIGESVFVHFDPCYGPLTNRFPQAINHLIREGKLPTVEIAGKRFVTRSDIMSFEPDKGGRPSERKKKGKTK